MNKEAGDWSIAIKSSGICRHKRCIYYNNGVGTNKFCKKCGRAYNNKVSLLEPIYKDKFISIENHLYNRDLYINIAFYISLVVGVIGIVFAWLMGAFR